MLKVFTDGSFKNGYCAAGYMITDNGVEVALRVRVWKSKTRLRNVEAEISAAVFAFEELVKMYGILKNEIVVIVHDLFSLKDHLLNENILGAQDQNELTESETDFISQMSKRFTEAVRHLGCQPSFEKVRGHNHTVHNKVDFALSTVIARRLLIERANCHNENLENSSETSLENPRRRRYVFVDPKRYSEYEYNYMGFVLNTLRKLRTPVTMADLKHKLLEKNPYLQDKSKNKRDIEGLIQEMVSEGFLKLNENGFLEYKPIKLVYMKKEFLTREPKRVVKKAKSSFNESLLHSKYVQDYVNFLHKFIRSMGRPVGYDEIVSYIETRKNPWKPEKFNNASLEELLEFMVSSGKIERDEFGRYYVNSLGTRLKLLKGEPQK